MIDINTLHTHQAYCRPKQAFSSPLPPLSVPHKETELLCTPSSPVLLEFFDEKAELMCSPWSSPLKGLFDEKAELACSPSSSPLKGLFDKKAELVCSPWSSLLKGLFDEKAELVCSPWSSLLKVLFDEKAELVCSPWSSPLKDLFDEKAELVCSPSLLRTNGDKFSTQSTEENHQVPTPLAQEMLSFINPAFYVAVGSPKLCSPNQLAASGSTSTSNYPQGPELESDIEHTPQDTAVECSSPPSMGGLVTGRS